MADDKQKDWRSDLRSFFDGIKREDDAFAEALERVSSFYAYTVKPALEEISRELKLYGRDCETGEDAGRAFIIVRDAAHKVEFQYAIVADVKIEGVTPYVHCWYEETPSGTAQPADRSGGEQAEDKEAQDEQADETQSSNQQDEGGQQEQGGESGGEGDQEKQGGESGGQQKQQGNQEGGGDKQGGEGEGGGKGGEDDEGDKGKSAGPKRTKTIERLADWEEGDDVRKVTRDDIKNDFTAHYKDAISRLRAPIHAAKDKE
jgi:hypothetical protein